MPRILCIGHTTYDTFYILKDADVHCDITDKKLDASQNSATNLIDRSNCKICFDFGSKVPVDEIYYGVGGGACNVSVGLSLLNLDAYLYSIIGSDVRGQYITDELKQQKVNTKFLFKDLNPTNQAAIISYSGERTIFSYNKDRDYQMVIDENMFDFDYVFVTSIGQNVGHIYNKLIDYKKRKNFKLIYNPGSKELKNSVSQVREFLKDVDVLICNKEEAGIIVGKENLSIEELFSKLTKVINMVCITDGGNGAYSFIDKKVVHQSSMASKVVERTGAGDAFSSGFIAGLIYSNNLHTALTWAVKNSSNSVTQIGSTKGLLTYSQLKS